MSDKMKLWRAYLAAQLALVAAIDQQGSTPADDAACVAGVQKTIRLCREAVAAISEASGDYLAAFETRWRRGQF